MSVVTHHPTNSPGTTLLKHEQELMIQHPHQHPELWAHQGLNEVPEPTVGQAPAP